MSILITDNQFHLKTRSSSYIMQVREGFLLHLYYGKALRDGNYSKMLRFQGRAAFSPTMENGEGFILDDTPLEYPCTGRGDMRTCALGVINPDGSEICDLRYIGYDITEGAVQLQGLPAVYSESGDNCRTLIIHLFDDVSRLEVNLYYGVFEDYDIITRHAVIANKSEQKLCLNRALSACLEFDKADYDVISNFGTHCRERNIERFPLSHGRFVLSSRRGASSHVCNPFLILASPTADENSGDTFGAVLVYSGSFWAEAAQNQFDTARLVMGLNPEEFGWTLSPNESFTTPQAVLSYSGCGLTQLSHSFASIFARRLCRGKYRDTRRPVLLNSWEACYFGFDDKRICDIGSSCAELGLELLVIDDGWFGHRNDDRSSLGDWYVNRNKLKGGLEGIYEHLSKLGVKLGIWFEPEMVSPDSDLYRAHPDWCLHINGRPRSEGRHQLILDLSRSDVTDYIYNAISDVLKTGMIAYVKWDFNRNVTELGSDMLSPENQRETGHRYYLGLYSLLERLVTDYPDVLFESCSGGGGRFDAGMLYYMPQVWTSDNSDAIERLRIQYGTSLVYPISAMSAHISVSPNHQTAHVTPFETRFTVALTGSFGYELDPTKLSEKDKELVKSSAEIYKKYGDMLVNGDYYRLRDPHKETRAAWCTVSKDKKTCIAGYVLTHVVMYGRNERLTLAGLNPDTLYRDTVTGEEYYGDYLMNFGLQVPLTLEYSSMMWILEAVK